jgi:four helix bundle protein
MRNDSIVYEKSFKFAKRIIKLYKFLVYEKKERVISHQIMKSGTSIGANISEATYAQSRKDFINKMNGISTVEVPKYKAKMLPEYDVFISHANADKEALIEELYNSLNKLGVKI